MRNEDSTEWSIVANPNPPNAAPQANIHQLLLTARRVWLSDALRGAMADVDQAALRNQVTSYVPVVAQRVLATAGIRDEAMFPLSVVLEARPSLVAYYRLLLGVSQKRFYKASTGMTPFKKLEQGAPLSEGLRTQLHDYCIAMCVAIAELVIQADSTLEARDVEDLQLLTLGSFYYGSLNNKIGQAATLGVFTAITEIVDSFVQSKSANELALKMPDGRRFRIIVAGDPDMRIVESLDDTEIPVVSIELKAEPIRPMPTIGAEKRKSPTKQPRSEGSRCVGPSFTLPMWTLTSSIRDRLRPTCGSIRTKSLPIPETIGSVSRITREAPLGWNLTHKRIPIHAVQYRSFDLDESSPEGPFHP